MSGRIKSGFDPADVIEAFANLFKLPREKAQSLFGTQFVIEKEIDLKVAKTCHNKLDSIGLEVKLKRHGGLDALSLEPAETGNDESAESFASPLDANTMECPKCGLRQPKAGECSGCGVFVNKVKQQQETMTAQAAADSAPATAAAAESSEAEQSFDDTPSDIKMMILPAAAAVLGAFLWYGIAISLDYEFGLIAWLIGGAVGYAATLGGVRGEAAGAVCALLVVAAILGGKYMTMSSFQTDLAETLAGATEYEGVELMEIYQEELKDARDFADLPGDEASLRQFMVSHLYREA